MMWLSPPAVSSHHMPLMSALPAAATHKEFDSVFGNNTIPGLLCCCLPDIFYWSPPVQYIDWIQFLLGVWEEVWLLWWWGSSRSQRFLQDVCGCKQEIHCMLIWPIFNVQWKSKCGKLCACCWWDSRWIQWCLVWFLNLNITKSLFLFSLTGLHTSLVVYIEPTISTCLSPLPSFTLHVPPVCSPSLSSPPWFSPPPGIFHLSVFLTVIITLVLFIFQLFRDVR